MAFANNNSSTDILNRILSKLPSNVDTSEGSFLYDAVSPIATELAYLYSGLDVFLADAFAQTATGSYLDNRAGEFGLSRNQGSYATGQITFTGINGTTIPAKTIVQTHSGLQYTTNLATIINSIVTGTDNETDAAFLKRFLAYVQTPATSGNAAHYVQWAEQVSGIGAVQVYPLWNGGGTVKVCAIDVNSQPLSGTLLTALSTYIEAQRPIGAAVTYETVTALSINIAVKIVLATGYTDLQIQTALNASITSYLASIAFNQNSVSFAKIGSLILSTTGVADYSNLTLNAGTVNITIPQERVAVMGTLTITN